MAMFMNQISNEEKRSEEMLRTSSVLVMVLVLALWSLSRCAGLGSLQNEATKRCKRLVAVGEEGGA
jgi:hypothetical protein